ncbi:MAG: carboxymuconolactone decarboxylase family protein [Planctomycetota bacterium]|jgi:alkylhydroperoxidase family enzyme
MAWIETVDPADAEGPIKGFYDKAVARAGKVFQIVRMMSPNPAVLDASMKFYLAIMHGASPLSRRQREMLATVVSRVNSCHY